MIAVAVGLAWVGAAQASFAAFADGNDRPGRLDIKRVTEDHGAGGRLVHTITTFGRWPKSLLGPSTPNFFILDISLDGDDQPERFVFIFSTANGRMVAVVTRPNGRTVGSATASKPNAKTVKVSFLRSRLGNPTGYRWLAASVFRGRGCRGGCTDRAPNGRVLHDIRAPVIDFPQPQDPAATNPYDLDFTVSDLGGSGPASWELQRFDGSQWVTIASSPTTLPFSFMAAAGATDQFRVVAVDGHGNQTVSPIRTVTAPP